MSQIKSRIFLRNFLLLLLSGVFTQGVSTFTLLVTARQLGSEQYGQYIACITFTGFASIAVNLGAEIWLLREGRNGLGLLGEAIGSILSIKIMGGVFWLGLICAIAPLLNPAVFPPYLLILSAVFSWLNGIFTTVMAGYKASLRNTYTLFLQGAYAAFWLGLTFVLLLEKEDNPSKYIYIRIIALCLPLALGFLRRDILPWKVTWPKIFQTIKELPPFAISELLAWAYMRFDVLIVGFALDQHRVGIYAAAENIVNAMFFVPAAAYETAIPFLAAAWGSNRIRSTKDIISHLQPFFFIGLLLSLLAFSFGLVLPNFLGTSFEDSADILLILTPVPFLHSIIFGLTSYLVAFGEQKRRAIIQAQVAVINIVLNILLVYKLGIHGMAVVYVFTEILLLIGYIRLIHRHCKCFSVT